LVALRVFKDADELGAALAQEIIELQPRLLGCPGGRSLRSTYRALAATGADLSATTIVMMDEYIPVPPTDAPHSCRGFGLREITHPLGIPDHNLWVPAPDDPASYDDRIARAGGVDLFLLASGASDGHVAFIPPRSSLDGGTSIVRIAESTRRDNVVTFPELGSVAAVPRYGVSVGLATIANSRGVRLVIHGADKREAAARILALDAFDAGWPASVVYACANAELWLDEKAYAPG
jgi:glucosamine-6-phosphate deaminase